MYGVVTVYVVEIIATELRVYLTTMFSKRAISRFNFVLRTRITEFVRMGSWKGCGNRSSQLLDVDEKLLRKCAFVDGLILDENDENVEFFIPLNFFFLFSLFVCIFIRYFLPYVVQLTGLYARIQYQMLIIYEVVVEGLVCRRRDRVDTPAAHTPFRYVRYKSIL